MNLLTTLAAAVPAVPAAVVAAPAEMTSAAVNAANSSFWMPPRASTAAYDADWLFYFILAVTVFFTVLVTAIMIYFALKYRHREGKPAPGKAAGHSTALEVTWTVIPTIIVIVIFFYGFRGFLDGAVVPPNAIEVKVTGRMWNWYFDYPAGGGDSILYLPRGRPVQLTLASEDTIHSLYVPAFRLKRDVVPGRYNKMWMEATEVGEYPLECTEYCGTGHSEMGTRTDEDTGAYTGTRVIVLEPDDWEKKMAELSDIFNTIDPVTGLPVAVPLADVGNLLYTKRGCQQCHSLSGEAGIGPSWKNLWGASRQFADGTTGIADENYIREAILYPQKQIVAGYGGVMPSYLGSLKDREIDAIIEYTKTLSDGYKPVGETGDLIKPREAGDGTTTFGGPRTEGNPDAKPGVPVGAEVDRIEAAQDPLGAGAAEAPDGTTRKTNNVQDGD